MKTIVTYAALFLTLGLAACDTNTNPPGQTGPAGPKGAVDQTVPADAPADTKR